MGININGIAQFVVWEKSETQYLVETREIKTSFARSQLIII